VESAHGGGGRRVQRSVPRHHVVCVLWLYAAAPLPPPQAIITPPPPIPTPPPTRVGSAPKIDANRCCGRASAAAGRHRRSALIGDSGCRGGAASLRRGDASVLGAARRRRRDGAGGAHSSVAVAVAAARGRQRPWRRTSAAAGRRRRCALVGGRVRRSGAGTPASVAPHVGGGGTAPAVRTRRWQWPSRRVGDASVLGAVRRRRRDGAGGARSSVAVAVAAARRRQRPWRRTSAAAGRRRRCALVGGSGRRGVVGTPASFAPNVGGGGTAPAVRTRRRQWPSRWRGDASVLGAARLQRRDGAGGARSSAALAVAAARKRQLHRSCAAQKRSLWRLWDDACRGSTRWGRWHSRAVAGRSPVRLTGKGMARERQRLKQEKGGKYARKKDALHSGGRAKTQRPASTRRIRAATRPPFLPCAGTGRKSAAKSSAPRLPPSAAWACPSTARWRRRGLARAS